MLFYQYKDLDVKDCSLIILSFGTVSKILAVIDNFWHAYNAGQLQHILWIFLFHIT